MTVTVLCAAFASGVGARRGAGHLSICHLSLSTSLNPKSNRFTAACRCTDGQYILLSMYVLWPLRPPYAVIVSYEHCPQLSLIVSLDVCCTTLESVYTAVVKKTVKRITFSN